MILPSIDMLFSEYGLPPLPTLMRTTSINMENTIIQPNRTDFNLTNHRNSSKILPLINYTNNINNMHTLEGVNYNQYEELKHNLFVNKEECENKINMFHCNQSHDKSYSSNINKPNTNQKVAAKPWTHEEDMILAQKYGELGSKWTTIAKFIKGRSQASIRNRWALLLKNMRKKANRTLINY